jgi:hypothetical protein
MYGYRVCNGGVAERRRVPHRRDRRTPRHGCTICEYMYVCIYPWLDTSEDISTYAMNVNMYHVYSAQSASKSMHNSLPCWYSHTLCKHNYLRASVFDQACMYIYIYIYIYGGERIDQNTILFCVGFQCLANVHASNGTLCVCQRVESLPSSRSQDLFAALVKQMYAAGLPLQTIAVSTGRPSDMSLLAAARIARCAAYTHRHTPHDKIW